MPIDSSIYLQQQSPDIVGGIAQGLKLRDFMDKRKADKEDLDKMKAVDKAYAAGMITNPDGSQTFDKGRTLSELAKVGGKEYLGAKTQFDTQEREQAAANQQKQLGQLELIGRLAGSATDQKSYENMIAQAQTNGLDISKLPKQFDPGLMRNYQMRALSAKEQIENHNKQREFGLKERELGIKQLETSNKAKSGENLPIDTKKSVEGLAGKNANKISIANQIEAVMGQWDELSDDQKITQGGQLLKTLNSPEGADAIGSEEAQRLGNKLQFAMGNFTNDSPTRIGRDLPGFKEQATNTARSLRTAITSNQGEIDRMMGRPVAPKSPNKTFKTNEIDWAD